MPDRPEPATPSEGLAFPSVARLELDELLDQLIARASEVKLTQGRLRGLLDATHHITAGLELDDLVQRIVESARTLVGARYAALGVVRESRLIRFVHVGMDEPTVARIGELPQGKGVLGSLIDDPKALRLQDLATHPASVGFPEHHPPMHSFLGVPLLAGGTVYGNLYVTETTHEGGFTPDDEQLLTALAGAAGIAVENALLLESARRRERWQAASARLARSLLSGDLAPDEEIQHLLDTAVERVRAEPDRSALSVMVNAEAPIPMSQIIANIKIAIGGGINEPRDALSTIVFGLLTEPEQLAEVKRTGKWGAAFEEGVRWVAPIQASSRRAFSRDRTMEPSRSS